MYVRYWVADKILQQRAVDVKLVNEPWQEEEEGKMKLLKQLHPKPKAGTASAAKKQKTDIPVPGCKFG